MSARNLPGFQAVQIPANPDGVPNQGTNSCTLAGRRRRKNRPFFLSAVPYPEDLFHLHLAFFCLLNVLFGRPYQCPSTSGILAGLYSPA